jgi:putative heme transporter
MSTVDGRPPAEIATPTPDLPRPSDSVENRARPDVPPALRRLAAWSWRLLVILAAAGLVLYLLILLKVIVVPVIVALFLATLLVPLVRWLEACGWRHIWAVLAVFLGAVLLIAGIVAGFVPLIGNELGTLRQRADEGVAEVQHYIASRPFGLSEADLNRYLDQARERFTENSTLGILMPNARPATASRSAAHRALRAALTRTQAGCSASAPATSTRACSLASGGPRPPGRG